MNDKASFVAPLHFNLHCCAAGYGQPPLLWVYFTLFGFNFKSPPDFSFTFRESSLLQQQPVLQFTDKFSGDGIYLITLCLLKWTSNSGEDPYPGEPEPPLFSQYLALSGVTRDQPTQTE